MKSTNDDTAPPWLGSGRAREADGPCGEQHGDKDDPSPRGEPPKRHQRRPGIADPCGGRQRWSCPPIGHARRSEPIGAGGAHTAKGEIGRLCGTGMTMRSPPRIRRGSGTVVEW